MLKSVTPSIPFFCKMIHYFVEVLGMNTVMPIPSKEVSIQKAVDFI